MTTLQADGTNPPSLTEIGLPPPSAFLLVLALAFALGAWGGDEPPSGPGPNPNPQTGLIQVSTATTGADLDPDGYSTAMGLER